jgi:alpha-amylase
MSRGALLVPLVCLSLHCGPSHGQQDADFERSPEEDTWRRDATDAPMARTVDARTPRSRIDRPWEDEVVYLVMPDRFVNGDPSNDRRGVEGCASSDPRVGFHGGDLAGLEASVDYFRELGVTALWMTPLYHQSLGPSVTCPYHGYWVDYRGPGADGAIDDGAVDPRLGDAPSLDRLIAALHREDMRVVLDVVANHAGDRARIVAEHHEFFADPRTCGNQGRAVEDCPFRPGSPDFRLDRADVAQLVVDAQSRWLERYDFDGVRVDAARHLPAPFVADSLLPSLRAQRPQGWIVGEVYSSNLAELERHAARGYDRLVAFNLHDALVSTFARGESTDRLARAMQDLLRAVGQRGARRWLAMIDNHDTPRFASQITAGVSTTEARARNALAHAALLTLSPIPQLWQGSEVALLGGPDPDNRRPMPSWAFSSERRGGLHPESLGDGALLFRSVQRWIAARRAHVALRRGDYVELWRQGGGAGPNALAFARVHDESLVVVALHAANDRAQIRVPIPSALRARFERGRLETIASEGEVRASLEGRALLLEMGSWSGAAFSL